MTTNTKTQNTKKHVVLVGTCHKPWLMPIPAWEAMTPAVFRQQKEDSDMGNSNRQKVAEVTANKLAGTVAKQLKF